MEIVRGRDDKVFDEIGNIPKPAKGIPPVAARGLGGKGGGGEGKRSQHTQGEQNVDGF